MQLAWKLVFFSLQCLDNCSFLYVLLAFVSIPFPPCYMMINVEGSCQRLLKNDQGWVVYNTLWWKKNPSHVMPAETDRKTVFSKHLQAPEHKSISSLHLLVRCRPRLGKKKNHLETQLIGLLFLCVCEGAIKQHRPDWVLKSTAVDLLRRRSSLSVTRHRSGTCLGPINLVWDRCLSLHVERESIFLCASSWLLKHIRRVSHRLITCCPGRSALAEPIALSLWSTGKHFEPNTCQRWPGERRRLKRCPRREFGSSSGWLVWK